MTSRLVWIVIALVVGPLAYGQDTPDVRSLARDAGIIFTGTVEMIQPAPPASRGDIGAVRVTFRVSNALRGASPGAALIISEWDGLWISGDRYRVGEELLVFLYPPSGELGLTSTVGGARGRIVLSNSQLSIDTVARQIADASPVHLPRTQGRRRWGPHSRPPLAE